MKRVAISISNATINPGMRQHSRSCARRSRRAARVAAVVPAAARPPAFKLNRPDAFDPLPATASPLQPLHYNRSGGLTRSNRLVCSASAAAAAASGGGPRYNHSTPWPPLPQLLRRIPPALAAAAAALDAHFLPACLLVGVAAGCVHPAAGVAVASRVDLSTYVTAALFVIAGLQVRQEEAAKALKAKGAASRAVETGALSSFCSSRFVFKPSAILTGARSYWPTTHSTQPHKPAPSNPHALRPKNSNPPRRPALRPRIHPVYHPLALNAGAPPPPPAPGAGPGPGRVLLRAHGAVERHHVHPGCAGVRAVRAQWGQRIAVVDLVDSFYPLAAAAPRMQIATCRVQSPPPNTTLPRTKAHTWLKRHPPAAAAPPMRPQCRATSPSRSSSPLPRTSSGSSPCPSSSRCCWVTGWGAPRCSRCRCWRGWWRQCWRRPLSGRCCGTACPVRARRGFCCWGSGLVFLRGTGFLCASGPPPSCAPSPPPHSYLHTCTPKPLNTHPTTHPPQQHARTTAQAWRRPSSAASASWRTQVPCSSHSSPGPRYQRRWQPVSTCRLLDCWSQGLRGWGCTWCTWALISRPAGASLCCVVAFVGFRGGGSVWVGSCMFWGGGEWWPLLLRLLPLGSAQTSWQTPFNAT